jgi:hypothetical protein
MLNDLRQQHQQQRVMPAMAAHQAHLQQLRAAHAAACAAVTHANAMAVRQAMRSHAAPVQQVKEDNERKVCDVPLQVTGYCIVKQLWKRHTEQLPICACVLPQLISKALMGSSQSDARLPGPPAALGWYPAHGYEPVVGM